MKQFHKTKHIAKAFFQKNINNTLLETYKVKELKYMNIHQE